MSARWTVLGLLASAIAGCSSSTDGSNTANAGQGTGGGLFFGGGGGSAAGTGAGASGTTGPINACGAQADSTGCIGDEYAGENLPLDIYIMFDQSCSMSCNPDRTGPGLCCNGQTMPVDPTPRIDQVRGAVTQFLQDPASQGIGVGIGYFGNEQPGRTSCDPSSYATPAVPIAPLPGNAQAIIDSLAKAVPTGETPTGAAIRGACTYAVGWHNQNPTHITVVLLVTDGFPEAPLTSQTGGCTPTIQDAVQAATTCVSNQLDVFVLGVGQQLTNLNDIAAAGGTKQAYLVGGTNVEGQVLQALNTIRATAQIPCALKIPPAPMGQTVNFNQINITYCNASKQTITFLNVDAKAQCDPTNGGWYYDNPSAPTQIELCPTSCSTVSAPGGSLSASVGCTTQHSIH